MTLASRLVDRMPRTVVVAGSAGLLVLLGACSTASVDGAPGTTAPVTTSTVSGSVTTVTDPAPMPSVPDLLQGFEIDTIEVDGSSLVVALATEQPEWQQGLMGVVDLGDLDGMLFVFPAETNVSFWMKDTLIPLDIAFFDEEGRFVDGFGMEPCTEASCPSYTASGRYRYALETPAGSAIGIGRGSMLGLP